MDDGSIPFDLTSDDYEGLVEGDDGEFYFETERPKKRLTKNQQIFGIFGDEESDEEDFHKLRKRQKLIDKGIGFASAGSKDVPPGEKKKKAGGISFVSAGKTESSLLNNTAEAENVEVKDTDSDSDSDGSEDSRFRFKSKEEPVVSGPKLESKVDLSESQMSQKYGLGFKLLQKQGWKGGGLGSKQDGIANPIEVAVRGKNKGLQKDDVTAKINNNLHGYTHQQPKSALDMLLGDSNTRQAEKMKKEQKKQASGWKKDAPPQPKREEFVSVRELRKEVPKTYVIRDMTGPQERVLTTLEGAFGFRNREVEFGRLQELKFNMKTLVEQSEIEVQTLQRDLQNQKDFHESLEEEIRTGKPRNTNRKSDSILPPNISAENLEVILKGIQSPREGGGFSALVQEISDLRRSYPSAFDNEVVVTACSSVMAPLARNEMENISDGILEKQQEALDILQLAWTALGRMSYSAWPAFVRQVLLDTLRNELTLWDVRDVSAVDFFDAMKKKETLIPNAIVHEVFGQCILPKLENAVQTWKIASKQEAPCHVWVLPWVAHVPLDRLRSLFEMVCHRLCSWLSSWNFCDPMGLMDRLRPWKQVFREMEWISIIARLRKRLMDMSPVEIQREKHPDEFPQAMFSWAECLGSDVHEVLEAKLFKPFLEVLLTWLEEDDCDYKVVLTWVKAWRTSIPKAVLETSYVERVFAYAFQVMKHHMTGGKEPMPTRRTTISEKATVISRPSHLPTRSSTSARTLSDMNIKEALEEIAGEQDICMVPTKHTSSVTNKQLYSFGKAMIFWEGNVVYFQKKDGTFEPLALEQLLKIA